MNKARFKGLNAHTLSISHCLPFVLQCYCGVSLVIILVILMTFLLSYVVAF